MQGNVRERLQADYVSDLGMRNNVSFGTLESPVVERWRVRLRTWSARFEVGLFGAGWRMILRRTCRSGQWDDFGEKITDEVVEAKRFKQVRAWGGVHMYQSSQERPGEQHRDKDIGRTDDKDHIVNNRTHTHREAMSSKVEKQVWMQFEGKSRPWDIRCDEGGDEMEKRWREKNGMGDEGMQTVSEGRVVSWNEKKNLENGAIVQVMGNVQGRNGENGEEEEERE